MARIFGTDGVRGLANRDITAPLALNLAAAAARVLSGKPGRDLAARPVAIVGYDSRASGEFLEAAVCAGLASVGVDVLRVGVLPTPAIAFLTAELGAAFGVMLSASHNPMPDNGIKFFAAGGQKLADEVEDEIEATLDQPWDPPVGRDVGRITQLRDAGQKYVDHLVAAVPNRLDGIRMVVDCANGAASVVGPQAYRLAGAEVIAIHADPDGLNINDACGSTHMEDLVAAVIANQADFGLAHDGDADRCLAVDADGNLVDGDQLMAVLAIALRDAGKLKDDTLVATVMSNLGFKIGMRKEGIHLVETGVGDRYVLGAMREGNYSLGGEQSGHVVMSEFSTTGDGVLTGLMLGARVVATGESLHALASVVHKLPQVLINVTDVDRQGVDTSAELTEAVARASSQLGDGGRVLLRPSGTEALVRVMVEAQTQEEATAVAQDLAGVVRRSIPLA